jgi:hypothetical protein
MHLSDNIFDQILNCGRNAAQRIQSIPIDRVWEDLGKIDLVAVNQLLPEALQAGLSIAIPVNEPPTGNFPRISASLDVIGVDGSQIYPRDGDIRFAYVSAMGQPSDAPAVYRSDFVDLHDLLVPDSPRPDLSSLYHAADSPTLFTDLWRSNIENQVALSIGNQYPVHIVLMDGPLLPPDPSEKSRKIITKQWIEWLNQGKSQSTIVAGVISGPRSRMLANLVALSSSSHLWEAVRARVNVSDTAIMRYGLRTGDRSALFRLGSRRENTLRDAGIGIDFFYAKVTDEDILRVEVPSWVSELPDVVNQIHSSILFDCYNLRSYPFSLAAAHFQVVIPISVSNDLNQKAMLAYLEAGGRIEISGKRKIKMAGYTGL